MMTQAFFPKGSFHAVSNTERQRAFRQRNPGYYGRLHRKRKAELLAHRAAVVALEKQRALEAARALPAKLPLMLPAPGESSFISFESLFQLPVREKVLVATEDTEDTEIRTMRMS